LLLVLEHQLSALEAPLPGDAPELILIVTRGRVGHAVLGQPKLDRTEATGSILMEFDDMIVHAGLESHAGCPLVDLAKRGESMGLAVLLAGTRRKARFEGGVIRKERKERFHLVARDSSAIACGQFDDRVAVCHGLDQGFKAVYARFKGRHGWIPIRIRGHSSSRPFDCSGGSW